MEVTPDGGRDRGSDQAAAEPSAADKQLPELTERAPGGLKLTGQSLLGNLQR